MPPGRSRPEGGVEDVETAAADEDPVRVGQAGQDIGRFTLDDRHAGPCAVGPQPLDVVGSTLDGEDPQTGGDPGALDADRPRSGADIPEHADRGQGQLAEDDGANLGLGDHPVAVGVAVVVGTPRQSHPVVARRRGRGRRRRRGGHMIPSPARPRRSGRSPRRPRPIRLHTAMLRGPQPASSRARPKASGGWSGLTRTATLGWAATAATAGPSGRPWADTTMASSQLAPMRAKASATDDGAG